MGTRRRHPPCPPRHTASRTTLLARRLARSNPLLLPGALSSPRRRHGGRRADLGLNLLQILGVTGLNLLQTGETERAP